MLKAGLRLACPSCSIEVVVVRGSADDVTLTCSNATMAAIGEMRIQSGHPIADGEGAKLGKRYVDERADLELLCTKAGPGVLACDGRALNIRGAKPLPSSD